MKPFNRMLLMTAILVTTILSLYAAPDISALNTTSKNKNIVKPDQTQPSYGGTVTMGFHYPPVPLDPIMVTQGISIGVMDLIFNGLVRRNSGMEIEPDLAESWNILADGRVYRFTLKKGVRFHDGVELTAEDVVFSYQRILDPATGSPYLKRFRVIERIEATDRYTVRIVLKEPFAPLLKILTQQVVIPKHVFMAGGSRWHNFGRKPIGTGAFQFKEWRDDDQITVEAYEDYFEGRPYLDEVVFKTYATSSDVWSAFMRQEIDIIRFLDYKDFKVVEQDSAFHAFVHRVPLYYLITYNLENRILQDKRVRQAIAHCVNRNAFITQVEKGYGKECTGPFAPASLGFNPEVKPHPYDPQKGMALLQEAGWTRHKKSKIFSKDGEELIIRMLVDARQNKLRKIAQVIHQELQAVGIKLEIQLYDDERLLTKNFLKTHRSQAHLRSNHDGVFDPHYAVRIWHSDDQRQGDVWSGKLLRPDIEMLIKRGQITHIREEKQRIYQDLHRLIYEEQPACFLYAPFWFHAASKRVGGAELLLSLSMSDYIIKDFYIRKSEQVGSN